MRVRMCDCVRYHILILLLIQLPINKLSDLLRVELAQAGYTEALTFALVSHTNIPLLQVLVYQHCMCSCTTLNVKYNPWHPDVP